MTGPGTTTGTRASWRLRELTGLAFLLFPLNLYASQWRVIVTLVRTQIARRNRRSLLGWVWNLVQPGTQALVLYLATRGAIQIPATESPIAGFGIFFAAQIIAQGMGEIVTRGPTLVAELPGWVKGSLFPLELLPPQAVGVSLYRVVPGGLLGVACVLLGGGPVDAAATLAAFAVALLLAVVWATAIGLVMAAVGVYLRDMLYLAPIITLGLTFVSPLYVDPGADGWFGLARNVNPLTVSMNLVLQGLDWIAANPLHALYGFAGPFVALWAAAWFFRRASRLFADFV